MTEAYINRPNKNESLARIQVFDEIKRHGPLTNDQISRRLGVSVESIRVITGNLRLTGKIENIGTRALGKYKVAERTTAAQLSANRRPDYVPPDYYYREGSELAFQAPSRFFDQLHWPNGEITDMEGNPLEKHQSDS